MFSWFASVYYDIYDIWVGLQSVFDLSKKALEGTSAGGARIEEPSGDGMWEGYAPSP